MTEAKTCDWPDCTEPAEVHGRGYAVGPEARTAELCGAHGSLWEQMVAEQRVDEVRKLVALLEEVRDQRSPNGA